MKRVLIVRKFTHSNIIFLSLLDNIWYVSEQNIVTDMNKPRHRVKYHLKEIGKYIYKYFEIGNLSLADSANRILIVVNITI